MTRCKFDAQDKRVLAVLDTDFTVSDDGEVATVSGEMAVEIIRPSDADGARYQLQIIFPGNFKLQVKIARAQLLDELGVAES